MSVTESSWTHKVWSPSEIVFQLKSLVFGNQCSIMETQWTQSSEQLIRLQSQVLGLPTQFRKELMRTRFLWNSNFLQMFRSKHAKT